MSIRSSLEMLPPHLQWPAISPPRIELIAALEHCLRSLEEVAAQALPPGPRTAHEAARRHIAELLPHVDRRGALGGGFFVDSMLALRLCLEKLSLHGIP